ncbi:MAG: hypothetical protein Q6356_003310 [Candidatus Wukongarchaeota archaeon]|nr:hypothetical protein [Candidatus Wukongarchaeota archaeon]
MKISKTAKMYFWIGLMFYIVGATLFVWRLEWDLFFIGWLALLTFWVMGLQFDLYGKKENGKSKE